MQCFHSNAKLRVIKLFRDSFIHMLTGTLNFYATFSFHRPETVKRKKKWSLKVRNMKAEKILLSRHEAHVAQWTSVLDF